MDYIVKDGQVYAAIQPKEDKKPKKKDHQPAKKKLIFDGVDIPKRPIKQEDPVPDPHIVMPRARHEYIRGSPVPEPAGFCNVQTPHLDPAGFRRQVIRTRG